MFGVPRPPGPNLTLASGNGRRFVNFLFFFFLFSPPLFFFVVNGVFPLFFFFHLGTVSFFGFVPFVVSPGRRTGLLKVPFPFRIFFQSCSSSLCFRGGQQNFFLLFPVSWSFFFSRPFYFGPSFFMVLFLLCLLN